ncbi:TerC family protein [Castellaniella ginsengisoli]|uniref:TerC family protein n=1 Tax=Castellaniella ginsengisoli TaxID=546114 RepID=A0AB39D3J7_9BURK
MFEWLGQMHWGAVFQIVLIDILLGGDNAVVIALACRRLERRRRLQGILWGTAGAIAMRVILIAFALTLLTFPGLKIVGALLLLWIGIKLLLPESGAQDEIQSAGSVWAAVRTIIIADFVMSLDNVIAIAGAAQNTIPDHRLAYVVFGLLLSVPIIVWGSTLVLKLIDRYPLVVTLGAGLLGWIAGGMLVTDAALAAWLGALPESARLFAEIFGALFVMGLGTWLGRRASTDTRTMP